MPLPNLLIPGSQKSGTTWLHKCLSKSKQVFGSTPKELFFFTRGDWKESVDEYKEHFPEADGVSYYFESTANYFCGPTKGRDIAKRVQSLLGEPQIIVVLRNPIDRYASAYNHNILAGRLERTDLITEVSNRFAMVDLGRYASIAEHWLARFPNIHFYLYDDLSDKAALMADIMGKLGLQNDIPEEELEFTVNSNAKRFERRQWDGGAALLDHAVRAELHEIYTPEVERLQTILQRDLSVWLEDEGVEALGAATTA